MEYVVIIACALWALSFGLMVLGSLFAIRKLCSPVPNAPHLLGRTPISILKPLCGVDEGLQENLESFFQLDYPSYEIVFAVTDPHDGACLVVRRLIKKYPKVCAELKIADIRIGENPKINNLFLAYRNAKYDCVVISDSNVCVSKDYLSSQVALLKKGVGLVTAAVSGVGDGSLGSQLEATYLSTYLLRWVHLSQYLGNPLVMGKSMLFKRSDLARTGGIDALGRFIAEDYAAGAMMQSLGLKVVVMNRPVVQNLVQFSFGEFWARHLRWGRIRKSCEPTVFMIEWAFGALCSGLIGSLGAARLLGVKPSLFLLGHLLIWCSLDLILARLGRGKVKGSTFFSWICLEILTVPLWICVLCGNSVSWRGNRIELKRGGICESEQNEVENIEELPAA